MMYDSIVEKIQSNIVKITLSQNGKLLNYNQWIDLIQSSNEFIEFFNNVLSECSFKGFFWEVKPINKSRIKDVFEFVLVDSSILPNIIADDTSFKKYFEKGKNVVTFKNLRGDAQLIVPTQVSDSSNYNHLASFVRNAPKSQIIDFWKLVSIEYEKLIGESYKWLSTAGLGVYWLHVRVDSTPKYYRFSNYKQI